MREAVWDFLKARELSFKKVKVKTNTAVVKLRVIKLGGSSSSCVTVKENKDTTKTTIVVEARLRE